jgi:acetyl-CoA acetyltransferase
MEKYGTTSTHFAKIGWKNHKHSKNNPYAQFQEYHIHLSFAFCTNFIFSLILIFSEYTLEQVESARAIFPPLTLLQCSPTVF